jgi:molybdopterin biosynthesis enzyme MoaB
MRFKILEKTPMASLSRAVAGVRTNTLIKNLPRSPDGAMENLQEVWSAISHTMAKIQGDQSDCALIHPS